MRKIFLLICGKKERAIGNGWKDKKNIIATLWNLRSKISNHLISTFEKRVCQLLHISLISKRHRWNCVDLMLHSQEKWVATLHYITGSYPHSLLILAEGTGYLMVTNGSFSSSSFFRFLRTSFTGDNTVWFNVPRIFTRKNAIQLMAISWQYKWIEKWFIVVHFHEISVYWFKSNKYLVRFHTFSV